jgi:glycosyltransferase involved in cell wall biosynthesis
MQPCLSVVVTAYNRKEFLKDSLESLLKQTLPVNEFEVILITNFEYDIGSYHDLQISHYLMDGTAWEFILRGIELSNGEIVCFLDDDDIFKEGKLEKLKEIFQSNPDLDYYRHNFMEVDYNLKPRKRNSVKHVQETKFIASPEFRNNLIYLTFNEVFFNASTITIRKKMINVKEDIFIGRNVAPDFMLWTVAVANARAIYIDNRELSLYRIHKMSVIHSEKGEEKYSCKQDDAVSILVNYGVNDRNRQFMLNLMTLKLEVNLTLFCNVNFTVRHYVMNLLMILLSGNRFKATLVLFKKVKLMNKPMIVKMLKREQSILEFLGRYKA